MNALPRLLLSCCTAAVVSIFAPLGVLYAQTVVENLWVTDGSVKAIAFSGDTIYIGGSFKYVGPSTGNFVALDSSTGTRDAAFPKFVGDVYAIAPDGSGGWYVGGNFTVVGGVSRNRVAHIKADKTLDATWNPGANNGVGALAVSGSTVYAGGDFTSIGGATRNRIAALDTLTGAATSWNPNADSTVRTLALSPDGAGGSTVYAGGEFTAIGDSSRNRIAALDASTGKATNWNPNAGGTVFALAVLGSAVYAGGSFTTMGDSARNLIAALDRSTGKATPWNANMSWAPIARVSALAVSDSTVYAGGFFIDVGDSARFAIAEIDTLMGTATSWSPYPNMIVQALAVSPHGAGGSTVFVGGYFTAVGDSARNYIAAIDASTGAATSWNPSASGFVNALAVSGSTVCAGGWFTSIGGETRNRIAAINAITGEATSWNPNANSTVCALALSPNGAGGSTVYAGGDFTTIGGQTRNCIAALDASTGNATSWNPNVTGFIDPPYVLAIVVSGSTVYAGGHFTKIGGSTRNYIAAIDTSTGIATIWNPDASYDVNALAVSPDGAGGSTVYAGGAFTTIGVGDSTRNRIAAIDASTGKATGWNPNANSSVFALAVSPDGAGGSTVYAGGNFTMIGGGATRNRIAALDASTGLATSWDPNANDAVGALAVSGSTVYAGGGFTNIGGQPRNYIAAIDSNSPGVATSWNPNANSLVNALALDFTHARVYVCGDFPIILNDSRGGFAGLTNPYDPALPVQMAAFTVNGKARAAELHWTTASEIHSHGFDIERHLVSVSSWQKVAFLQGSGASTGPRQYSYVDKDLAPGRYAYRIKQIDKDGSFTYTSTVEVEVGLVPRVLTLAHNYPNPFNPSTTIEFTLAQDGKVTLKVFDLLGREVTMLVNEELKAGVLHRAVFDASRVSSGLYFCRLETGGKSLVKKMLLMK